MCRVLLLLLLAACAHQPATVDHGPFVWHPWSKETFAKAKAERRLLLVDGAAEWCHWCHVMDQTTYRDPEVGRILREKFIAVRVDIDERPDLAERYADWGWPATILLSPDAEELGKFRGFLPPERMIGILQSLDPAQLQEAAVVLPGVSVSGLPAAAQHAINRLDFFWDEQEGSWGLRRKVPIGLNVVWELKKGDRARAIHTLQKQRALIDRVWGGIYQYSAAEDWSEPHFEKLVTYQAPNLEAFSLGYAVTKDPRFLEDAKLIYRYLTTLLSSPDGGFCANQDADLNAHERDKPVVEGHVFYALDDAGRRALGVPWIDTHVYARENGLAISALVRFAEAASSPEALQRAVKAAELLAKTHVLPDGTVKHAADSKGPWFLADAAGLGLGFAHLGVATGDKRWAELATRIATRMKAHFAGGPSGALFDHTEDPDAQGVFQRRIASFTHNVTAARLLNATGDTGSPVLAAIAANPRIDSEGAWVGEFLLAVNGL